MKKTIFGILLLSYLLLGAQAALAFVVTKQETRDIVGRYGAINGDSPYFPHDRIPHPNSGTSDGRIKTTNVDEYPGTGPGDFQPVQSVTIGMHDHDDKEVVAVYIHGQDGSWTLFEKEHDIPTFGGNTLCGEASTMYGLNRHPHNDAACYLNNIFNINATTDEIMLKFSCSQTSDGCPRNDDVHVHISNIIWNIQDAATPTPNPTVTPIATKVPTKTPTKVPTPTTVPATPTTVAASCWKACPINGATNGSLRCMTVGSQRLWRNSTCPLDNNCVCDPTPTATMTPMPAVNGPYCPL